MINTASIVSFMKYEHDFINQWIEYHIQHGFSHFYLLIDNIIEEQPEYEINELFRDKVTLINLNEDLFIKQYGCSLSEYYKKGCDHSFFLHNSLNKQIFNNNIIKEDWVTTIGIDQFIYFNGLTIQQYLETIDETCTQIIFPWSISSVNNENLPYDYLMKNVNLYKCKYGWAGHSNGLIKTNNLLCISHDSHNFVSKSSQQKVFILNEYFTMNCNLNTQNVFHIVDSKMKEINFDNLNISSFHFIVRNVHEIIIKIFFYWNRDANINILIDNIKDKSNEISIKNWFRNYPHIKTVFSKNLNIPNVCCLNTNNMYNKLIINKLKNYDITEEEYNEWIRKLIIYLNK